ncbi:MAG: hypothetical protein M0Q24_08895 [Sulfurimonas sp.]|uniref:hypothetical protein n=1 Tax=Sulfurimonas sp. TaxID=2022749 RepID=UPI0025F77AC4|nr:hypothetical protein [Sulfurimonas sp.]MCK9492196.1 hypothetical protein [Sulfurimonas sp.]
MQISSNMGAISPAVKNSNIIKPLYTEKISQDEVKEIKEQLNKNSLAMAFNSTTIQSTFSSQDSFEQNYNDFQGFLNDIGYSGKPIAELSKDEAAELVSEDGIFGIKQTSERIANFVINGAGGDEDKLRAGREGMLKGFAEAEKMWGGKLPEISQTTMAKATEMVDKAMHDLGFSIINEEV